MKKLIESIVRMRNPDFRFHRSVRSGTLLQLTLHYTSGQLRAMRLLINGHVPIARFLGRGVHIVGGSKLWLGKWVKSGRNWFPKSLVPINLTLKSMINE